ncbi:protein phosphatase 1 regulatory subunit 3G [Protobothrops mucrosquamatus]|uniref:protein phosphatase 1 regulatory subunit 3G n=1 Tax=Protobothrops mucrosquamatus TaxID=103944 RepID=UPI0010FB4C06|nr:protein phosphatase 1 regulatory subunit 3G [Protobothrops mucrosquamatus]
METRGSAVLSLGQLFAPFGERQPDEQPALAPAWREDAEEEEEEEAAAAENPAEQRQQQQQRDCAVAAAREKDEEALLEWRRRRGRSFSLPDSPSLAAARFFQSRRIPGDSDGSEDDEAAAAASPTGAIRGCCTKCKKRVQFADALGLCLASVKHYSAAEEPQVPHAVLSRLQSFPMRQRDFEDFTAALAELGGCAASSSPSFPRPPPPQVPLRLAPPLDGADEQVSGERLRRDRVCLEEVAGTALAGAPTDVRGVVRVLSCPGSKEVTVRYTFNEWLSFLDVPALPLPDGDPSDGPAPVERYRFALCLPPGLPDGTAVHFAICYRSQHGEHWDNNGGTNYTLRDCSAEKSASPP